MSAGRGWIAVVIMMVVAALLLYILHAALFFGVIDATGILGPAFWIAQQFAVSWRCILVVVILAVAIRRKQAQLKV